MPYVPTPPNEWPDWSVAPKIRDGISVRWEQRVKPGEESSTNPTLQNRWVLALTWHIDANTWSCATTAFHAWITQAQLANGVTLVVGARGVPGQWTNVPYTGAWDVESVQVDDQGNGCTRVTWTIVTYGDWQDTRSSTPSLP